MKKNILWVAIVLLGMIHSSTVSAQAFKKGTFAISGGFGIGAGYGYRNFSSDDLYYNNYNTNSYTPHVNFSVGAIFPAALEIGISNKFGIGATFQHGSYANTDSEKSTANSVGLFAAFHFARREKIELYTRLNFGLSFLDYTDDIADYYSNTNSAVPTNNGSYHYKLKGGFVKPSFGMRLWFSDHVGMFADAGIGVYSFNTNQVETDQGTYDLPGKRLTVVMINAEITTGLAFKF